MKSTYIEFPEQGKVVVKEEDISEVSPTKYNLQKFGFGEGFKIQPESWFKVLASFAKESRSVE